MMSVKFKVSDMMRGTVSHISAPMMASAFHSGASVTAIVRQLLPSDTNSSST